MHRLATARCAQEYPGHWQRALVFLAKVPSAAVAVFDVDLTAAQARTRHMHLRVMRGGLALPGYGWPPAVVELGKSGRLRFRRQELSPGRWAVTGTVLPAERTIAELLALAADKYSAPTVDS